MTNLFKKTVIATALAATALAGAAPAMADGYRGGDYHHGGGDGAGLAIGAGIVGLAVGAIIAANTHHDDHYDRPYYANGYYPAGGYYAQPYWTWHDGYYWDHDGHRYEGYRHYDRGLERRGYGDNTYRGGDRDQRYAHDGYRGDQRHDDGGRGY